MFARRTEWNLAPNRFSVALEQAKKSGRKLLDLSASNPTEIGLRYDEPAILTALNRPAALRYEPDPRGLLSARQAIASYYAEHGANISPDHIILTTSTSEAYSFLFRLLCDPGDEVLVASPSYPLFDFLAGIQDVKLASYPLFYDHGWHIDLHALESAISSWTRAVLVVHPNNPTGSYVNETERTALNNFCNEHDLALIVDEVFLDYAHNGVRRPTFAANAEALTFTLSGLSKISALPQMKSAWIAASGPTVQLQVALQRLEVIADTYLSVNAPIQLALPLLLKQRKSVQHFLLDRLRTNLGELDRQLAKQKTCVRLDVEGGWHAVLRVPVTQSDEDLAISIMKNLSVLVHPGHFYDFPSDGYLIVSLITEAQEFSEGIKRLLDFLNL